MTDVLSTVKKKPAATWTVGGALIAACVAAFVWKSKSGGEEEGEEK